MSQILAGWSVRSVAQIRARQPSFFPRWFWPF